VDRVDHNGDQTMRAIALTPFVIRLLLFVTLAASVAATADWPGARGPAQDAVSAERDLPERWSPAGENLAWRIPYGGRSAPIVVGHRLYLQNTSGRSTNWTEADDVQERVMCIDTESGRVLWEHRVSVSLTDVPPHRVGWASPVADPETGHVYALGVAGRLMALAADGRLVWERSLVEEFGAVTTHGGRTVSPIVEGDLVIVNTLISGWGPWARGGNRYFAFDTRTGRTVWIASPQARHYDTNYAMPVAATVDGQRLIIAGGTDGAIHALRAGTGEPVWKWEISKRAINTSVAVRGSMAIVTHSEENLDSSEMGMVAAVNAAATGSIGPQEIRWRTPGWLGGFSSPVIDGDRVYQVDNGAVLGAFDIATGTRLWTRGLGTIQKASAVAGDGKLYVGTENGKFYILRPGPAGVEVLDEDRLGSEDDPERIIASVAIARGRVYLVSDRALYAIGATARPSETPAAPRAAAVGPPGDPASLHVFPLEAVVAPGGSVKLTARLFDARGHIVGEAPAEWSLEELAGRMAPDGTFVAAPEAQGRLGTVTATVGELKGTAQIRVFPPLPLVEDFEAHAGEAPPAHWVNATGKFEVREVEGTRALFRREDTTLTRRARLFMGPWTLHDYTVEADVRVIERRRQLGDVGVFAQQYGLVLFGNSQRVELHPWQPATAMTVTAPFAWKPDTWYRVKLRVENRADGTTRVQGKAWARGEPEPPGWLVEKVDRIPHRQGAPGLYADAPFGAYFDNIRVVGH
jgi:outer membrane protein assembly factor BamB